MESGHGSGSIKHLKTYPGATISEGDVSAPGEKADSPSSSSSSSSSPSSSSNSSLEDFFLVDGSQSTMCNAGTANPLKLYEDVQLAPKDDENNVSSGRSSKSGESSDQAPPSGAVPMEVTVISPDSSLDGLSATQSLNGLSAIQSLDGLSATQSLDGLSATQSMDGLSVTQSPKIQVMDRSGEPDPYRIPSSVFARSKSTTPMEWSVASNESLFSIHVGNNSFSRDHIFLMGRSGELGMPGELMNYPDWKELGKPGELMNFPDFPVRPPPHNLVIDGDIKISSLGEDVEKSTELRGGLVVAAAAAETVKEVLRAAAEDRSKQKIPPGALQSSSHSHRSDGSGASFAFPLLIGEGGRNSDSVKADSGQHSLKQPQPQTQPKPKPQTPGSTPNAGGCKWFPCFSCCCPLCC